jgi:hypothetical protein
MCLNLEPHLRNFSLTEIGFDLMDQKIQISRSGWGWGLPLCSLHHGMPVVLLCSRSPRRFRPRGVSVIVGHKLTGSI